MYHTLSLHTWAESHVITDIWFGLRLDKYAATLQIAYTDTRIYPSYVLFWWGTNNHGNCDVYFCWQ